MYWSSAKSLRRFMRGEISARAAAPRACFEELHAMAMHTRMKKLRAASRELTAKSETVEAVRCASQG